jgi:GNAT superfamily N-acetyltransferase
LSVLFESTRDPQWLNQYYALRNQCFKSDLGLPDFDGAEEVHDRQGHIVIARSEGQCIAGARIVSAASMAEQLTEFGLSSLDSCVWERFVIHPSFRGMGLGRDFCSALIEVSRNLGFNNALVLSTLRISRLYRMCHAGLGVEFNIRRAAPECAEAAFASLEHYLSVVHLHKRQRLRRPVQQATRGLPGSKARAGHCASAL